MKRIPLIECGNKVLFYADEFVCRCGKCEYSDPSIIIHIIDSNLLMGIKEHRLATKIPTKINRGVSCIEHHIDIYKNIYGINWRKKIAWDSSHIPNAEKQKNENSARFLINRDINNKSFYAVDSRPLIPVDFFYWCMMYAFFRFHRIIWYKILYYPSKKVTNLFTHADYFPYVNAGRFIQRMYRRPDPLSS